MNKKATLFVTAALCLTLTACGKKEAAPAATMAPIPTAAAAMTAATPAPTPTEKPVSPEVQALTEENKKVWDEMARREWMEGRLVVPSVGIDVALFSWGTAPGGETDPDKTVEVVRQQVVDDTDSALLYYDNAVGNIIADHSNQDFSVLANIKEGDAAYILSGERIVSLRCNLVTDGTNTGNGITDKDGDWHHNEDYVCYTCLEDWTHVLIVGFTRTDEDFFDMNWIDRGSSGTPGAVVTTVSVPSATTAPAEGTAVYGSGASATPTPAPSATAAPTATPAPTAAPQNNDPEPVYYDPVPTHDIYADGGSNGGGYYNAPSYPSGDGYLS